MMYPMDYIWIIIIAFGVISSIMNKGKTKSKDTQSNMPTFGGGEERSLRPSPTTESDDSYESYERTPTGNHTQPSYLNHDTGEGVSQMWEDTMENRQLNMQQDINRVTARLDSSIPPTPSDEWDAYATSDEEAPQESSLSEITNPAVNGLIWSEILGSPRAKHAFSRRKL
ncbi:hypothetical protein ACP8HI_14150 [Paenibacillus sp. FA6]|uniref:hypothetical protein n=1 Tax=Paenibacillus sp. FA6 TaxID=3413029 RepID=UPI003F655175